MRIWSGNSSIKPKCRNTHPKDFNNCLENLLPNYI
jgi:hypothetical protein